MLDLFKQAGWVAWPLGFFSVLGLGIILERLFTLGRLRQLEERAFMMLQLALEKEDAAMRQDPQIAPAPVTQVINALVDMKGASEEALQQAAEVAIAMQRQRLRRYLTTLATIGSTAPFIGLFGTVLGIMTAFQALSRTQNSQELAAGISEALSATAVGLLVAIPAIIAYNMFQGRVQAQLLQIHNHVARLMPLLHSGARTSDSALHVRQEV
ncbi:MAG: MotA/TolQ/ExbB proton channel family protein [Chloroherpetonaceae bacterium]|nr:MotA/TolQ/ExbB proton channel family protein [Chthonomonadaceae bacterium]MDW8208142.1 MotA/TolQ/ExbB proton channel family protein [Chloroherpetonaceae bacterium]